MQTPTTEASSVPVVRPERTGVVTATPEVGKYYLIGGGLRLCFDANHAGARFAGSLGSCDTSLSLAELEASPVEELRLVRVGEL